MTKTSAFSKICGNIRKITIETEIQVMETEGQIGLRTGELSPLYDPSKKRMTLCI